VAPPIVKVSKEGTQQVEYSKKRRTRYEIEFDSGNEVPFQVRWNWKIKNDLLAFILKSVGFSQSLPGFRQAVFIFI
jgi:hypothetical protein